MKHLIALIVALGLSGAALAEARDVRCLKTTGERTPILLQFELAQGKERVAYVRYQRGSKTIPLRLLETSSEDMARGRPSEFTTTWGEMIDGRATGTYTVVSQGARIYGFTYLRARDKKTFEFEEDPDAIGERGCVWSKK